jgi:hypothetical protein
MSRAVCVPSACQRLIRSRMIIQSIVTCPASRFAHDKIGSVACQGFDLRLDVSYCRDAIDPLVKCRAVNYRASCWGKMCGTRGYRKISAHTSPVPSGDSVQDGHLAYMQVRKCSQLIAKLNGASDRTLCFCDWMKEQPVITLTPPPLHRPPFPPDILECHITGVRVPHGDIIHTQFFSPIVSKLVPLVEGARQGYTPPGTLRPQPPRSLIPFSILDGFDLIKNLPLHSLKHIQ